MNEDRLRVIVVIPAYNESGKIDKVVSNLPKKIIDAIVVVDDCSKDNTAQQAKDAGAIVIRHEHNLGVGGAIRTGIDYAINNNYDVVAIVSGDNQHDPADLLGLLKPILQDGYDFVQGSRRVKGLQAPNIGWFRRFFTWIYVLIFRLLTGYPITDATNGGRAFRVTIFRDKSINLWQDWLNTYELEPYLLYKVVKNNLKITEAPVKVLYHSQGTTKMKPVRDWWRILRPTLYLALGIRK
jgi:dolichol-phosphate mannosyltransferase